MEPGPHQYAVRLADPNPPSHICPLCQKLSTTWGLLRDSWAVDHRGKPVYVGKWVCHPCWDTTWERNRRAAAERAVRVRFR